MQRRVLRNLNPLVIKEKYKDLFLRKILLVNWGLADFGSGYNLLLDFCLTPEANSLFLGNQCFLVQATAFQIFTKWQICHNFFMSGWVHTTLKLYETSKPTMKPFIKNGIQIKFCQIQFTSSGMARRHRCTVDTSWKKTFLLVTSL